MGGGGEKGTAKIEGEQSRGGGHRGNASRGEGTTGRVADIHDRADMQPNAQGAAHHRRCHAAVATIVWNKCCENFLNKL